MSSVKSIEKNDLINELKGSHVKHKKVQILCIDMSKEFIDKLTKDGFSIEEGSFGQRYKVKDNEHLGFNGKLPTLTEKDILIINLEGKQEVLSENPFCNMKPLKKVDMETLFVPQPQNYFNPSYYYSKLYKNEIHQVVSNGGIVIVFSDSNKKETYYKKSYSREVLKEGETLKISNYDWLTTKSAVFNCEPGKQVVACDTGNKLLNKVCEDIIKESYNEIEYRCCFTGVYPNKTKLFINKFNETIGYMEKFCGEGSDGYLIVLPHFNDQYKPIKKLFTEFCSDVKPSLFPQFVTNNWVDYEEYILPDIKRLILEKEKIIKEYEEKLSKINEEIKNKKEDNKFVLNILVSQGFDSFLVDNLYKTLKYIGYKNVIKLDDQVEGNRQEDLRILDNNRFTVVEIKGHNGNPTEDDCQAVLKYINRNMRSEKRTDIHGVLIVNHKKILPPAKRDNPAFTKEQIEDAERDGYSLVSTWELYKAVRLFQQGLLSFEEIDKEIHTPGLFKAIPSSWRSLGKIEHLYKEGTVACFHLEIDKIFKNDKIIVQDNNNYFEQVVEEMMINKVHVGNAEKGDAVSIKINQTISKHANIFLK